jgi:hypothetical protein
VVRHRRRWAPLLALMAAAALSLAGCADNDTEAKPEASPIKAGATVYVGKVDASEANIGLVTQGDKLAGMVCQDANTSLRLDAVPLQNGTAELVADGTVVGTVSVAADIAVGTVDFDGSKRKFRTELATGGAGVYRLPSENQDEPWDGWVVLNDGTYTGTSKSKPSTGRPWIDPDSQP